MILFLNFYILMFLMSLFSFVFNRKHLLSMLLSLEYIMLVIFMFLFMFLNILYFEMYMLNFFLVFSVCEGVLGLSILVSLIRTHGNDYFQSFNII